NITISFFNESDNAPVSNLSSVQGYMNLTAIYQLNSPFSNSTTANVPIFDSYLSANNNPYAFYNGFVNGTILGYANSTEQASGIYNISVVTGKVGVPLFNFNGYITYTTQSGNSNSYVFVNTQYSGNVTYSLPAINGTADVGYFSIYVLQNGLQQIPANVQVFRYVPNTNSYQLNGYITTPSVGGTTIALLNNDSYEFNIYGTNGNLIGNAGLVDMFCSANTVCPFQLSANSSTISAFTLTNNIVSTCSLLNGNTTIQCTATDPTSTVDSYTLSVVENGLAGTQTICDTNYTGYSITATCSGLSNTTSYYYTLTANSNGGSYPLQAGTTTGSTLLSGLGDWGYFMLFIIIIALSLLSYAQPQIAAIFDVLSFVIGMYLGLGVINMVMLIPLIVVVIVYMYKLHNG
ncbi:MAG: hypothetical protein QW478_08865, partial [Candidatus Micrarchaeaceae archaeon]